MLMLKYQWSAEPHSIFIFHIQFCTLLKKDIKFIKPANINVNVLFSSKCQWEI